MKFSYLLYLALYFTTLSLSNSSFSQSTYSDSTLMIIFDESAPQSYITSVMNEFNCEEIWVSPISETRLWKVLSFPYELSPNNWISNINEQNTEVRQRPDIDGTGLNYDSESILDVPTPRPTRNDIDSQMDCHGKVSSFANNSLNNIDVGIFDTGLNYTPTNGFPQYFFDMNIVNQYDHIEQDNIAQDENGHGTHISSIIAHTVNKAFGSGNTQTSPDIDYDIRKTFDITGQGNLAEIILAFEQSVVNGLKIANFSWSFLETLNEAINSPLYISLSEVEEQYGVLIIAAAGNDQKNLDHSTIKSFPACYNLPNILSVTSYDCNDDVSYFANYGQSSVDIAAPGQYIPGKSHISQGITYKSGTSQSTAIISGIAASLASHQSIFNYEEIICAIMSSAEFNSIVNTKVKSAGIIDANAALQVLLSGCNSGGFPSIGIRSRKQSTDVYPNPATDLVNISYESKDDGDVKLSLLDINGKVIDFEEFKILEGHNTINYKTTGIDNGIYTIILNKENIIKNYRIIILN